MGVKLDLNPNKKQIPEEFKELAKDFADKGFITTSEKLINWVDWLFALDDFRLVYAVEMMQTSMPRYDLERFGAAPRASPRQSDDDCSWNFNNKWLQLAVFMIRCQNLDMLYLWEAVLIVRVLSLFIFCCRGCDKIVPVDIYIPGCPPSAEALLYGILQLQKLEGRKSTKINNDRKLEN